jgi:hypothetical protein
MIVVLLLSVMGAALIQIQSARTRQQVASIDTVRSLYIAEAGDIQISCTQPAPPPRRVREPAPIPVPPVKTYKPITTTYDQLLVDGALPNLLFSILKLR